MVNRTRIVCRLFDRFRRDSAGNIAIIFAVALIPLVVSMGAAVDFSNIFAIRSRLQDAADAASIGAIVPSSSAFSAASSMSADGLIPAGQQQAIKLFDANIAGGTGFTVSNLTADVSKSNGVLTSTVSFTAGVQTYFLGLIGLSTVDVAGSSSALWKIATYFDFHLLLDNSPSMGLGATMADIDKMVNNTPDRCAFACHDLADTNNYYNLAKSLGVSMRIDVLRTATQRLMDTATAMQTLPNQFRMALYTFGDSAATAGLTTISHLSSNLSHTKSKASAVDLMSVQGQNENFDQDTNYDSVLSEMNYKIPHPGTGTSPGSRKEVLFFVTDGVTDEANSAFCTEATTGGRCQEPINPALCQTLKDRGIMIAVLYTTYLALPTNDWYNTWISPFANKIAPAMENCASPGLYFEVSPTEGISDAMNALFLKAVAEARITK